MFENITPTNTMIEVALPFWIMSKLSNVFHYANIKEKGFIMTDEKFGLALARKKPAVRAKYANIQKAWYEKFVTRYPNADTENIPMSYFHNNIKHHFETYGYCRINIAENDIWYLVDTILYRIDSDPEIILADQNENKLKKQQEALYGDD